MTEEIRKRTMKKKKSKEEVTLGEVSIAKKKTVNREKNIVFPERDFIIIIIFFFLLSSLTPSGTTTVTLHKLVNLLFLSLCLSATKLLFFLFLHLPFILPLFSSLLSLLWLLLFFSFILHFFAVFLCLSLLFLGWKPLLEKKISNGGNEMMSHTEERPQCVYVCWLREKIPSSSSHLRGKKEEERHERNIQKASCVSCRVRMHANLSLPRSLYDTW